MCQLVAKGYRVLDLTQKSWFLNKKTVEELTNTLQVARIPLGTIVVLDLFRNTSTKYRQADDTLALASKAGGATGWHMLGEVVAVPDTFICEQVGNLGGLFSAINEHSKIVLPAIPRYVFGSCCKDATHAQNTALPSHSTTSVSEHIRQRNTIIKKLHDARTQNLKVLDILSCFSNTSSSIPVKFDHLKKVTHRDNVHLTERGYELLAENIVKEAKVLMERQSSRGEKPELHNTNVGQEIRSWGGFFCMVGFGKTTVATHKMLGGGGAQRHHPYHP